MYEMGYDLIVNDEEAEQLSESMMNKLKIYESWLNELIKHMDEIKRNAIVSGDTAANLEYLNEEIHSLLGETDEIRERIGTLSKQYVQAIEEADGTLYDDNTGLFPYLQS